MPSGRTDWLGVAFGFVEPLKGLAIWEIGDDRSSSATPAGSVCARCMNAASLGGSEPAAAVAATAHAARRVAHETRFILGEILLQGSAGLTVCF